MPHPNDLKTQFITYIGNNKDKTLSDLKDGEFRLATYNIHYFTDTNEEVNTYEGIIKNDIKLINADIIGLQEIVLGNEININTEKKLIVDTTELYNDISNYGYHKTIICNSVPSWFNSLYGNMVLVHDRICNKDVKCLETEETIHTFDKSDETVQVSGKHQGTQETRCFILLKAKYNNYNLYIYVTHLDVASETLRTEQINYIITDSKKYSESNDVVFIMGDFNSFNKEDLNDLDSRKNLPKGNYMEKWINDTYVNKNGSVLESLMENKFFDCHSKNKELMTTWNTTRVDFIFCNKKMDGDFRAEYLYTLNSDHIPVILTLTNNTTFEMTGGKRRNRKTVSKRIFRRYKKTHRRHIKKY
jgi:endonuclease/exonuclease/phosphatase family metal-dependent hydrolase